MRKIVAVHSYKGGTGKTSVAINLAVTFAKQGKRVCLFDLDFRAPSLLAILQVENVQCWLNDYLNGTCEISKVLVDLSHRIQTDDKLFVCLANPAIEAIRDMSTKDKKWEGHALKALMSLKEASLDEKGFDYLIFDTGPGVQYSSMNGILAADFVVVVTTGDRSDVEGTKRMVRELYNFFEKRTGLVLNKVLEDSSESKKNEMRTKVDGIYHVPLIGLIPCFCDILRAEGRLIFAQDKPDHSFTKILNEIARQIDVQLG